MRRIELITWAAAIYLLWTGAAAACLIEESIDAVESLADKLADVESAHEQAQEDYDALMFLDPAGIPQLTALQDQAVSAMIEAGNQHDTADESHQDAIADLTAGNHQEVVDHAETGMDAGASAQQSYESIAGLLLEAVELLDPR